YGRLEHGRELRAWAYTIAARVAADVHRRRRPEAEPVEGAAGDSRPAYAEIEHLANGLPPTERAAVVLRYGYDLSYEDIGAALELDLAGVGGFPRRVLEELALVPYGEVTTYGRLAERAERPRAARAVGTVMNRNPLPIVLPCHRVVGSTGKLVGYGGGLDRKEALLRLEGALL